MLNLKIKKNGENMKNIDSILEILSLMFERPIDEPFEMPLGYAIIGNKLLGNNVLVYLMSKEPFSSYRDGKIDGFNLKYAIAGIDVEKNRDILDVVHKSIRTFNKPYNKVHFVTNFVPATFVNYPDSFHRLCAMKVIFLNNTSN